MKLNIKSLNYKNKLGFIVSHPTQFEGPMYQYTKKLHLENFLKVYYYNHANRYFKDKELDINKLNSWDIDLLSNYEWELIGNSNILNIRKIIDENKYLIVNGYNKILAWKLLLLAKLYGRKIGLRLDSVLWNNKSVIKKIYKFVLFRILNLLVDTFWITGKVSKEYLTYFGIPDQKIKILSYCIDNEWFINVSQQVDIQLLRNQLDISKDDKVILCVSKLIDRELPFDVIRALSLMKEKKISLLIAGDGEDKIRIQDLIIENKLESRVKLLGYVKYTNLPSIYAISDLFVHASRDEPWGVSVQEALACGKPVITSNFVGSSFDLINSGLNGFIYKYGDYEDLQKKIELALHLDKNIILKENRKILSEWNYSQMWDNVNNHIEKL